MQSPLDLSTYQLNPLLVSHTFFFISALNLTMYVLCVSALTTTEGAGILGEERDLRMGEMREMIML